jgi:hypothetical protein
MDEMMAKPTETWVVIVWMTHHVMVSPAQKQACPMDINRQEAKSSVSINRVPQTAVTDFFCANKQASQMRLRGAGLKAEPKKLSLESTCKRLQVSGGKMCLHVQLRGVISRGLARRNGGPRL